ncbi:MAG: ABC transporter permease [Alphaproteobacteria bacterium]|nr:ABC transporter permease [Alphaproteobacteria bacterium]
MTPISLALVNLRSRPMRTLATLASVILAIGSFIALVGLARGVESSLLSALNDRGTDAIVSEAGAADLVSSIVSESLAERLAEAPGVSAAAAELSRLTSLENGGSVIVVAWPVGSFPWATLNLTAGRLPASDTALEVVLGTGSAARFGVTVGDSITVFQTPFEVVGIVQSDSILIRNLSMVPLKVAQRLTFREGQATSINLRLSPDQGPSERDETVAALRVQFPMTSIEVTSALVNSHTFARIADALSRSIAIVALFGAVLAIFNTMSTAVRERRGEIAIMSAVGWARSRIVGLILFEALIISVCGGILGCVAGIAVAESVSRSAIVAGIVNPTISPLLLVQAVSLSLLIGLAGAVFPALQTVSLSPASVLRGK